MKKAFALLAAALTVLLLGGCALDLKTEYDSELEYTPAEQFEPQQGDKLLVKSYRELQRGLLAMVYAGQTEGTVLFEQQYDGSPREDLDAAFAALRRSDALWAYCVANAHADLSRIVAYNEAAVHVDYDTAALPVTEIVHRSYTSGLDQMLKDAIDEGRERLVILIDNSTYSSDGMAGQLTAVYRKNPGSAAAEPKAEVHMFSGGGRQRLYDIELKYGLSAEALRARRQTLRDFIRDLPISGAGLDQPQIALTACAYLTATCKLCDDAACNTVYDALIEKRADSEGLALAYVELCQRLGVPCQIVYGQYRWQEHCWNIIELDGAHYHVDVAACIRSGLDQGFLRNDDSMWADYRWDTASYEFCNGALDYWTLTGEEPDDEPSDEPTEEPTEEPTDEPTEEPTEEPTDELTEEPTEGPADEPTEEPTEEPTNKPKP